MSSSAQAPMLHTHPDILVLRERDDRVAEPPLGEVVQGCYCNRHSMRRHLCGSSASRDNLIRRSPI